jgi:hypothetical protein
MKHSHRPTARPRRRAPGPAQIPALRPASSPACPLPLPGPFPPYAPPAILYRAALEAVAADCLTPPGKMEGFCDIGNS